MNDHSAFEAPRQPIKLYRHPLSGHAHRAELFLSLLGLPYQRIEVDLLHGEQKKADFLAKNPFGQVPVIEDGATTVADSNAILVYLARRYDTSRRWLPESAEEEAEVQRWFSVSAGPLVNGPAMARIEVLFGRPREAQRHQIAAQLFRLLDQHLDGRAFLVGSGATVADLSLYSYTAHAPEGGISLEPYPHIRGWLSRIEALPGFVGMQASPVADALTW